MPDEAMCCKEVWDTGRWPRSHPCGNTATVERDGKPYCGIHDPDKQEARAAVQDRRHNARTAYRASRARLIEAAVALVNDSIDIAALREAAQAFTKAHAECVESGAKMWDLY